MSQQERDAGTSTCIYCTGPGPFDREHVIPVAFGTFGHNLVLDCVCAGCNRFFSRDLELFLARDSAEAVMRWRFRIKRPEDALTLRRDRIVLTIHQRGPWFGARGFLAPTEHGDELEMLPYPQVGFRKPPARGWTWVLEEDLSSQIEFFRGPGMEIKIVGPDDSTLARLRAALLTLGITFRHEGTMRGPIPDANGNLPFFAEFTVDQAILRSVAKIAFNYLAYSQSADLAHRTDFDPIREFVRFAKPPPWQVVEISRDPILFDDTAKERQTSGHLIVLYWDRSQSGIEGKVSLFNEMTYRVRLCPKFSGVWHPIASGHHFDIEAHTVRLLGHTNLRLPSRP